MDCFAAARNDGATYFVIARNEVTWRSKESVKKIASLYLRWQSTFMHKQPAIYILANKRNGTLYTGVTSNLIQRTTQHRTKQIEGFSNKYGCDKLIYYEQADSMEAAILREKRIKAGSRQKKLALIAKMNPDWQDLFESLL